MIGCGMTCRLSGCKPASWSKRRSSWRKKKVEYDLRVFQVWRHKVRDREAQAYHLDLEYRMRRRQKAAQAASGLFDTSHRNSRMAMLVGSSGRTTHDEVEEFCAKVRAKAAPGGGNPNVVHVRSNLILGSGWGWNPPGTTLLPSSLMEIAV